MERRICVIKSRRFPLSLGDVADGGSLNVYQVVKGLTAQGLLVEAFTRHEPGALSRDTPSGLTLHEVPFTPSLREDPFERDFEEGRSFVEAMLTHAAFEPSRFRAVHTHHWSSGVGLIEGLPTEVRLIHTPHLLALEKSRHTGLKLPDRVRDAEARLCTRADLVLALSASEAETLQHDYGIRAAKVRVVNNGVSTAFHSIPLSTPPDGSVLHVLCVARLCRQKGLDVALTAIEILLTRGVDVRLTIIGDSYGEPKYEADLRQRSTSPPLRGLVDFHGPVMHLDLPSILATAHAYIQPSRYESQGLALLEAMAAARPIVASNLPAVREYVSSGLSGLLVETGSAAALADALEHLRNQPSLRVTLGTAARIQASPYSWDAAVEKTLAALLP